MALSDDPISADTALDVVVETPDLDAEVAFFTERAGFRVEAVVPADDPQLVVVARAGTRVRIVRGDRRRPVRLAGSTVGEPVELRSPGGSTISIEPRARSLVLPPGEPSYVASRAGADSAWVTGRAGMRYRDLLPGRWGGRFIASHIHIPDGGPVPDYVHYHRIRFQMIVVKAGWVEVVYEDQGPPFVLHAGDAVLQPPEIRHRVLCSSAGLEVVEIGCPAAHETLADHSMTLPTDALRPDREFAGQRFARSVLADRPSGPWRLAGYRAADTGFGLATGGLVGARIVEPAGDDPPPGDAGLDATEFSMLVVLDGRIAFEHDGTVGSLEPGDSVALPAGEALRLRDPSPDLRLLDVTAPA